MIARSSTRAGRAELRRFGDALRFWLGKSPLYGTESEKLLTERMYLGEATLPEGADLPQEWMVSVAAAPSTRESFREAGIRRAERRKALRFEERTKTK